MRKILTTRILSHKMRSAQVSGTWAIIMKKFYMCNENITDILVKVVL